MKDCLNKINHSSHSNVTGQRHKSLNIIPLILIIFIGIVYFFMGFYMPPLGDDLGFYHTYANQNDCWYSFPRFIYRHWIWSNARFADFLTPVGVYMMPLWLRALTFGIMTSLFFYLIVKISTQDFRNKYFWAILIVALVSFSFRWDAIWMEYCATYNYVWSATFTLLALIFILHKNPISNVWYWWLSAPFFFIAPAMHEAIGMPVSFGMILYFILSDYFKRQNTLGKIISMLFIAGGIFTMTSPASYNRVGAMLQPEPILEMLMFSGCYVIVLMITIISLLIWKRKLLAQLIHTPWIIFASAAVISTCFMLVSQYGGRTGWFAQTFALIAIFIILSKFNLPVTPKASFIISTILSVLILFHYCYVAYYQKKLGTQAKEVIELFKESEDGIIFYDYCNEPGLPWYLLRKTHGVPDDDDTYYRYSMSKYYCNGKSLNILPKKAIYLNWDTLKEVVRIDDNFISPNKLSDTYVDKIVARFPRHMVLIDDKEFIEIPFIKNNKCFYLYSVVDRDPGEK